MVLIVLLIVCNCNSYFLWSSLNVFTDFSIVRAFPLLYRKMSVLLTVVCMCSLLLFLDVIVASCVHSFPNRAVFSRYI